MIGKYPFQIANHPCQLGLPPRLRLSSSTKFGILALKSCTVLCDNGFLHGEAQTGLKLHAQALLTLSLCLPPELSVRVFIR